MSEWKEQIDNTEKISIYDLKKEIRADIEKLCTELETTQTEDIKIARLQNKIGLQRELLSNLSRIE